MLMVYILLSKSSYIITNRLLFCVDLLTTTKLPRKSEAYQLRNGLCVSVFRRC